jgi:hypothetical protein
MQTEVTERKKYVVKFGGKLNLEVNKCMKILLPATTPRFWNTTEFPNLVSPPPKEIIFLCNVVFYIGLLFHSTNFFRVPYVQFSCTFSTPLYYYVNNQIVCIFYVTFCVPSYPLGLPVASFHISRRINNFQRN